MNNTLDALLCAARPEIVFDSAESFYPGRISWMTDLYVDAGPDAPYGNALCRGEAVIAACDPSLGYPHLSAAFLGAHYADENESAAHPTDYLDCAYLDGMRVRDRNRTRSEALALLDDPGEGATVYGRVVPDGQQTWFQYWFFYIRDDKTPSHWAHAGDWEWVQLRWTGATSGQLFDEMTCSKHGAGDALRVRQLHKWTAGDDGVLAPVIYIARGSHACYPAPVDLWDIFFWKDRANGRGKVLRPRLELLRGTERWLSWPGHWGSATAPTGPRFKEDDPWNRPSIYHEETLRDWLWERFLLQPDAGYPETPAPDPFVHILSANVIDEAVSVALVVDPVPPENDQQPASLMVSMASLDDRQPAVSETLEEWPTGEPMAITLPFVAGEDERASVEAFLIDADGLPVIARTTVRV